MQRIEGMVSRGTAVGAGGSVVAKADEGADPLPTTAPEEAHAGQSHDFHRRIYERLPRFINLEQLELGNDEGFLSSASLYSVSTNTDHDGDYNHGESRFHDYQISSLDMSLASGLEAWEGLKKVKVVSCMRMLMEIRMEEVQWMVKAWPRLGFL
ncbi:hypothetical protein K457DRAFT_20711 [Linnemannia elongata AG-77]|uniref:Uncharacterized protein n=1 Tax=Linnemannia elongata AG-77 TaxID=1314771 RepID=A0A197JTE1_9FUNG|nr:hypothetical protein K457DRAFT_20711 [Linnemannia elongata AG-77]